MAHELLVEDGIVRATTSDILRIDERLEILKKISNAYDHSNANTILVDHFAAQLDCHMSDAKHFGSAIRDQLCRGQPCFIAILVSKLNVGNLNLIRTSLSHVSEVPRTSRIKCYTKEQLLHRDIETWRAKIGANI